MILCCVFLLDHCVFLYTEYSILKYIVMEQLVQGGREKLKDDGHIGYFVWQEKKEIKLSYPNSKDTIMCVTRVHIIC
ncbi:hypothetical protein HanRHA438_Chr04g0190891 [Helianthus annuus]|nr:hypothetical protein HanRHA438_Chr04g0190891 [Helianthus annuus]